MPLLFKKYVCVNIPSDFMVGSVVNTVRLPYLGTVSSSLKSGRFTKILEAKTFVNTIVFDRFTLRPNFKKGYSIVGVFEENCSDEYIVRCVDRLFSLNGSELRVFHLIVPYVRVFSLLDFLGAVDTISDFVLVENSDIAYLSFVVGEKNDSITE